jgi:hypothetical protein
MNVGKILLIVILVLSVASAFVGIPYAGLLLALAGVVYGVLAVDDDEKVYFLVMAVTLGMASGSLSAIPVAGDFLTTMLTMLSSAASAAAIGVIVKDIVDRLT